MTLKPQRFYRPNSLLLTSIFGANIITRAVRSIFAALFLFAWPLAAIADYPLAYMGSADIRSVSLSPSDSKVAILTKKYERPGGRQTWNGIDIVDAKSGETLLTHQVENRVYFWAQWLGDDVIIAYAREFEVRRRKVRMKDMLVSIDPSTGEMSELYSTKSKRNPERSGYLDLVAFSDETQRLAIMHTLPSETKLLRISLETGSTTQLDVSDDDTIEWWVDENLEPYLRIDNTRYDHIKAYYRRTDDGNWRRFRTINTLDNTFKVQRVFQEDLEFSVLTRPPGAETTGLYRFNLETGAYSDEEFSHPDFDLTRVKYATFTHEPLYASWWDDTLERQWLDDTQRARGERLEAELLQNDNWRLLETNRDTSMWLIYVSSDRNPGQYMLWDTAEETLHLVGEARPGLTLENLADRERVDFFAEDGTALHGYFTPAHASAREPKLVVMPHGGPVARDHMDWDGWAQFLSLKGYAVFQPNFRGSGGFGKVFEQLGHGEWGRKMQSDIEDGVAYLEQSGRVDPNATRAIIGSSYGGYAALMSAVNYPGRYQCTLSVNGVSDLLALISGYDEADPIEAFAKDIWVERMGSSEEDPDALKRISPVYQLDRIQSDIFFILRNCRYSRPAVPVR